MTCRLTVLLLTSALVASVGCASFDTLPLSPDAILVPTMKSADGKKDVAGQAQLYMQENCLEWDFFFLQVGTGAAECLQKFMNGLQRSEHDRVAGLLIETPSSQGFWSAARLFGFRSTLVRGIAVDTNENGGGSGGGSGSGGGGSGSDSGAP